MPEVTDPALLERLNAARSGRSTVPGADPGTTGGERRKAPFRIGNEIDLLQGVAQGLIDPLEGMAQLAEKLAQTATGRDVRVAPERLRNWARQFREGAQSSALGIAGEVGGNIIPALASGGVGGMPLYARAISGATTAAMMPVSGSADYWKTKLGQSVLGGVAGGSLPALAAAVSKAPSLALAKLAHSVGVPARVVHMLTPAPTNTLTNLAQRLGGGAPGRVAGEFRGQRPYELQRTSEGLPYYQAQEVDRTRKGAKGRTDDAQTSTREKSSAITGPAEGE